MRTPPMTSLLQQLAAEDPARPFVRELGGAPETLGDAVRAVGRWTSILTEAGVAPGALVATYLPAGAAGIYAWLAINGLGAIEVPIHLDYRGRYLAHVFRITQAEVAVIAPQYIERLSEVVGELPDLQVLVTLGEVDPSVVSLRTINACANVDATAWRPIAHGPHQPCTVLMTSGTTGPSKAVLVSHGQLRATADGAWPSGTLDARDRYYSVLPLYHVAAKQAVDAVLRSGGEFVIREHFSTAAFWSDVHDTGATATCLMGSMARFLMNAPGSADDAESTMAKVLMLPLLPELDQFRKRFGVRVRTLYNQTELSVPIASAGFDTPNHRSCGRLRAGYECRIVDDHDEPVATGEVGELVVRADEPWSLMTEYVGSPDATSRAWRNLWLHTGDAFTVDALGNYVFVDRLDDVIRRRGENISSVELETSVCEHRGVAECAAVGVESEWGEQDVKIMVVPMKGAAVNAAELAGFLKQRVPAFMVPRYIQIVEALPRTPTGKVRKTELRRTGVGTDTWDREAGVERPQVRSTL